MSPPSQCSGLGSPSRAMVSWAHCFHHWFGCFGAKTLKANNSNPNQRTMRGNTKFWLIISTFLAFGILFLALGIYVVSDYVLHYFGVLGGADLSTLAQRAAIAGLGGFIAGFMLVRKSTQWIRHARRRTNLSFTACPHCGAVVERGATRCKKCGKQLPA
jgi:hypothetical protein